MPRLCMFCLLGGALLLSGCHWGCLTKRESELNCPTDIRKTVPWCAGEDAIFRCPCGPSQDFYGHKPTCWGQWPASGRDWRDAYCGYQMLCPMPGVMHPQVAPEEVLEEGVPNPIETTPPELPQPPQSNLEAPKLEAEPQWPTSEQPVSYESRTNKMQHPPWESESTFLR